MPVSRRSSRRPRRPTYVRWWRPLFALLLLYLIYDLIVSPQGLLAYFEEVREVESLKQEIAELKAERTRLVHEISRLRNDPKTIEELIHKELGYVHPDELIVIVPREGEPMQ